MAAWQSDGSGAPLLVTRQSRGELMGEGARFDITSVLPMSQGLGRAARTDRRAIGSKERVAMNMSGV